MTHKRIQHSPHAIRRMKRRGFSRAEVRWLVTQGEILPPIGQKLHRAGYIRGREAKIAYLENAERILVITVMWVE